MTKNVLIAANNTLRTVSVIQESFENDYALSVVIPVYNAASTLRQALDSILIQDVSDLEIIIVDDASTDNSAFVINGYAVMHDNITVLKHEENSGYGSAMNDGICQAKGDWIAIVEPDDYILPGMYATMLREAAKYSNGTILDIDIVKTPYLREIRREGMKRGEKFKEILQCSYRHRIKPASQPFDITDENASHLLRHHPSIWSAIYRKEFLEQYQINFVEYPGAGWADNEFFYKTLLHAKNILYIDKPFYVYREETKEEFETFTKNNPMLALDRWDSMMDIIEELGINDEHILRSHISKGFTYLGGVLDSCGSDYTILNRAKAMFDRMPEDLVLKEKQLNVELKDMYKAMTGAKWKSSAERNAHRMELIKEAGYAIRNNGPKFMVSQVLDYLKLNRKADIENTHN